MLASAFLLFLLPQHPQRIDLCAEKERQVVVDREPSQYLGHVSTVLLGDGKTILAVYPKGHGKGPIVEKRSEDGGLTWTDRLPAPASWATSLEVPTIHRVRDAAGRERLILWSGLYPARLAVSEDGGRTFGELEKAGDWGGIVVMGDVIAAGPSGSYLAFFHDDGRFRAQGGRATSTFTVLQTSSSDGGLTWGEPRAIWTGGDLHLCEPGAVRSPDGAEIALLLRENARKAPSHVMFSRDEGQTWSAPVPLPGPLTGDRHTARFAKDGRLVVAFRQMSIDETDPWRGDFVLWIGSYADLHGGGEGQYLVRLLDNRSSWDCCYPGLEVLPDGTLVATTYGHWIEGEKPFIVSVRASLAELDRRARPAPARPAAARRADSRLRQVLDTLVDYRPTRADPTDRSVIDAEAQLRRALPRLCSPGHPLHARLRALVAERGRALVPGRSNRIRSNDPLKRFLVLFDDECALRADVKTMRPHPAAGEFPGEVPAGARPVRRTVPIDLSVPGRHSLGLYAAPGSLVTLRRAAGDPPARLRVRVGAHSDDVARRPAWERMPRISRVFPFDGTSLEVGSPFGGSSTWRSWPRAPERRKSRSTARSSLRCSCSDARAPSNGAIGSGRCPDPGPNSRPRKSC